MLELLTVSLVLLTFVNFFLFSYSLTSPSVLFTLSLSISSLVSYLLSDYFALSINIDTYICIMAGCSAFILGEFTIKRLIPKRNIIKIDSNLIKPFIIKNIYCWLYLIISLIVVVVIYDRVMDLASNLGGMNIDANEVLAYAQESKKDYSAPSEIFPAWVLLFQIINTSLCLVGLYCFLYNTILTKDRMKSLKFLLPTITTVIMCICMMQRSGMIELAIYFFTVWSIMLAKKYGNKAANKKIIKYGAISFVLFLIFFFYMRYLRDGVTGHFDIMEEIFAYMGSQIPGLDKYIGGEFTVKDINDEYIGGHTLLGLYYTLGKIGVDMPSLSRHMQFVFFYNNGYTNVYTIFLRYLMDFGYVIMLIILTLLGMIYGCLHSRIVNNNNLGFKVIIYASIIVAVYYSSVSELFFSSMLHPIYIVRLLLAYSFYRYMLKVKKRAFDF